MRGFMPETERTPYSAYIYTDGTLVQPYEEKQKGVRMADTVDITLGYCQVEIHRKYDAFGVYLKKHRVPRGRIALTLWSNTGFIALARGGCIRATMPDVMAATGRTRAQGIAAQIIVLTTHTGLELTWLELPELVSPVFSIEEKHLERIAGVKRGDTWGGMQVSAVKDLRKGGR